MLECSMPRYITCTLLPVDFLSLASSLPPSHSAFLRQTRKSNSKLTKRTFILSPLANCHLFADWNFLLLVGLRDKGLNEKKIILIAIGIISRVNEIRYRAKLPRQVLHRGLENGLRSQKAVFVTEIGVRFVRAILCTKRRGGEVKGYALFRRCLKTMACWGQVIIPLSATATPHVDLHNHHGLPYRALRS